MSPLRLNGSTSGFTTLDAPASAGSNTLVLPTGNGTADQALVTNGSGTLSFADRPQMVLGTAQNSTSGTAINFTSLPSWIKRITVMFNGVSTNGASFILAQVGAGSVISSGYTSAAAYTGASVGGTTSTAGYVLTAAAGAANNQTGSFVLTLLGSNVWILSCVLARQDGYTNTAAGTVTLGGTLDRIRITTVNGTDTFDAGSINILYEG